MKKHILLTLLIVSGLAIFSCDRFRNKPAESASGAVRIVCISKQLTEMMFALGLGDKVVGVDLSSTYPPEAQKLPTLGYHRLLNSEGIISLKPTLIMHDGGIAPEEVVTQLKKVGMPLKQYPGSRSIEDAKKLLTQLGEEFHVEDKAKVLCEKLDADMKRAQDAHAAYVVQHPNEKPKKVVIIHFGRVINNYLVVGQKSNATQMLEWAGGVNAITLNEGMKPLSPELIAEAQPDVILATDFGYDRTGGLEKFKELPGVALTPAAKNGKIYRVEEHDFTYFGPRTGENTLKLMELIHR